MGTICSNTPDSGPICRLGSHFYTLGYFIVRIKTQTMLMRDRKVSKWQKYKQFFCRLLRSQQKPPKILDDESAEIDKVCGAATKLFGLSWLFSWCHIRSTLLYTTLTLLRKINLVGNTSSSSRQVDIQIFIKFSSHVAHSHSASHPPTQSIPNILIDFWVFFWIL